MPDGKIVFSTALDNKGLEKDLADLKKKIRSSEDQIETAQKMKLPLLEQSKQLSAELDQAKAKLYEMQNASAGVFSKDQIAEQKETVSAIQRKWDVVQGQVEKYDHNIEQATIELERNKERAGEVAAQLAKTGPASEAMANAMVRAQKSANKFKLRLREVTRSALVFTLITQTLASFRKWVGSVINTSEEARAEIAELKAALLTLAQPLVEVLIPAFITCVDVLTDFINVYSRLVSFVFRTTVEESAEAAEKLNAEADALNNVGGAAKKAGRNLAAFDEINKLSSGSSASSPSTITPDFSALKKGLEAKLKFSLEDILFDWEDLSGEDIMAKIVTGLTALAGGLIGFVLGGPGGAALGLLIGAGVGLKLSDLFFDGDGKLSPEETVKGLAYALGVLTGAILGFVVGGPGGAALGIVIGAGATLTLSKMVLNNDGAMSEEEVLSMAAFALTSLVGGIIGFVAGGPGGAALGATIGAGISLSLIGLFFDGDGTIDAEEIKASLATALSTIAGGILGFVVGGPAGAAIGIVAGAGLTLGILDAQFKEGKGSLAADKLIGTLVEGLVALAGGVIGFAVGGPVGCAIGATIGVGLSLLIDKAFFSDSKSTQDLAYDEGEKIGDSVLWGVNNTLGIRSPSTEFEETGGYMVQGMANGIANNSSLPVDAFKNILNNIQLEFDAWNVLFLSGMGLFSQTVLGRWSSLWKNVNIDFVYQWNAILDSFQEGINNAVAALNELVEAANSLYEFTGKRYSNIGEITIKKLPIPRLAQGAVIPPNREFMAVLGDQSRGYNIEAPEDLIRKIVREESGGGMNTALLQAILNAIKEGKVLMVGQDVFARLVYSSNQAESKRVGLSLTGG